MGGGPEPRVVARVQEAHAGTAGGDPTQRRAHRVLHVGMGDLPEVPHPLREVVLGDHGHIHLGHRGDGLGVRQRLRILELHDDHSRRSPP